MKPSGPGLFFVGRFFTTVSVSVLVMDLLIFYISVLSCDFSILISNFIDLILLSFFLDESA